MKLKKGMGFSAEEERTELCLLLQLLCSIGFQRKQKQEIECYGCRHKTSIRIPFTHREVRSCRTSLFYVDGNGGGNEEGGLSGERKGRRERFCW